MVLGIFVILAVLYSLVVPLTQGEDELAHYRYISFIAQTGRLPVNYAEREQAWYRADWPPLYHLLVGWIISPLDTTRPHLKDVGEAPRRRLVGEIFYPRLIIYTEDAAWPWQDGILAWHVGRFISIAFSGAALVFIYLTAFELARVSAVPLGYSARFLATATVALLALTPRYLFTSAMLGDDSLFILLSAIFIWLLLRAWRGDDRWWLYALMGLLLGLSIATKYSTGLLPLAVIPVVLGRARQAGWSWLQSLARLGLVWLFTLIGAGWWFGWIGYHFNTIKEQGLLFGLLKPLLASGPDVSMRRIFAFFSGGQFTGQERPQAIEAGTFWDWLVYFFQSFWAGPILEHDPLFPWAYLLALIFCLLALVGLWRLWPRIDSQARFSLGILAFIIILLLPFPVLRFFLTHNVPETGQGRHLLYPAAQAIPILLVWGWATLWSRIQSSRFLFYLPFGLLAVWSLFQLVYMNFVYPDPLPVRTTTFDTAAIAHPLKHNFGQDIQLLGYDLDPDPEQAMLKLTLFWRAVHRVEENYRVEVQLLDSGDQTRFTWLSHPLNGRYPTRAWDQGDVIRDQLPLPLITVPPGLYTIQLNLLHEATDDSLISPPLTLTPPIDLARELPPAQAAVEMFSLGDWDYRLWVEPRPARHRQTLALTWSGDQLPAGPDEVRADWALVGPDHILHSPAASSQATAIFIVGADWPSGAYRLQLEDETGQAQTGPLLTVANEFRLFELPPGLTGQPDWKPVEARFANFQGQPQVELIGYLLPTRRLEPGGGLPLTLYWRSLAPVLGDYIIFDVLLNEEQQVYGGYDRLPREYYSTILWAEGEVIEDGFAVPVSPDAPDGVYQLHLGLYSLATGAPVSLPLLHEGQPTDETSVVIGPLKVGGPPAGVTVSQPDPQVKLNQSFGEQITLLGYDITDGQGQLLEQTSLNTPNLNLTLYWRAETELQADYTTFLHLRNETNENVAQKDRPPANGQYPTSLWDEDEIILDPISLPLEGLPPGQYTPVVGLYDLASGVRLPVAGIPENEVRLESVILP